MTRPFCERNDHQGTHNPTRVGVDFNRLRDDRLPALVKYSNGPMSVGQEVIAFDPDDGTERRAVVEASAPHRAILRLIPAERGQP